MWQICRALTRIKNKISNCNFRIYFITRDTFVSVVKYFDIVIVIP